MDRCADPVEFMDQGSVDIQAAVGADVQCGTRLGDTCKSCVSAAQSCVLCAIQRERVRGVPFLQLAYVVHPSETMPPVPEQPASPPSRQAPPGPVKTPKAPRSLVPMLLLLALLMAGIWLWGFSLSKALGAPSVDYSAFYGWAQSGKVAQVSMDGPELEFTLREPEPISPGNALKALVFRTIRPDGDASLLPLLHEKNVELRVIAPEQGAGSLFLAAMPWVLLFGASMWLSRRTQRSMMGGGPLGGLLKSKSRKFKKSTAVSVTFDDVAGLGAAKRDLQEVVQFLKEPEHFRRLGGKVPRGVLLVGPPGTGKTLVARAVAGESGVPFFSISASEFIEVFVGVGAARVRDLFEEAKKSAPAIIFIDEIDAIGRSRGTGFGGGHDEREQTLNQLLSEMDGFDRNDLTIVLAATNRPDVLDPALLRPGRFDRRVVVDRPELEARRAILSVHVKNKPLAGDVDLDQIARQTPGFAGADLANLVNEAALHATRQGADAITAADFAEAYDKIVLGDPREAKLGLQERRRIAVHESGHTVVAQFSPEAELPERVTIIPRGAALGATQQTPAEDRHLMTEPQLESRLDVLMGGYAAERLVLGCVSSGAENDLREATQLASRMVAQYGMSKRLGPAYYEHDVEHPFLGQRIATEGGLSDATTQAIEEEGRNVLTQALERASALLRRHRRELDRLSEALLDHETIEAAALKLLLEPPVSLGPSRVPDVVGNEVPAAS
jgi:cell division protease FtsH